MDIAVKLAELIDKHGAKHWSFAARKDEEFLAAVEQATAGMPEMPFADRVYAAAHGSPVCPNGSTRKLNSVTNGWRFCGRAGVCACARASVSQKSRDNIDHAARLAKTSATLKERYGDANPGRLPQAIAAHKAFYADQEKRQSSVEKGRQTMLERHGVPNAVHIDPERNREHLQIIAQSKMSERARTILLDPQMLLSRLKNKSYPSLAAELGVQTSTVRRHAEAAGHAIATGNSYEDEIHRFLQQHDLVSRFRDRTIIAPKEVDFFLSEHRLAIEFNGLYWHSDAIVDRSFHFEKWKACHDVGVRLLMINEDEWLLRPEVLRAKILNLCGRSERGVGARKLVIKPVTKSVASAFCGQHHIQGAPGNCAYAYGAFHGEQLVGVVTLNRQRGTQMLDLNRFCSDGATYAGMFSKILKTIRQNHQEPIVTFADLRYSDGGLYEKNGFINDGMLRPDYRYVKRQQTFHKSVFTKARIAKRFGIDMTGRTEAEAMRELGYSRIYDCGKIRYLLS